MQTEQHGPAINVVDHLDGTYTAIAEFNPVQMNWEGFIVSAVIASPGSSPVEAVLRLLAVCMRDQGQVRAAFHARLVSALLGKLREVSDCDNSDHVWRQCVLHCDYDVVEPDGSIHRQLPSGIGSAGQVIIIPRPSSADTNPIAERFGQ